MGTVRLWSQLTSQNKLRSSASSLAKTDVCSKSIILEISLKNSQYSGFQFDLFYLPEFDSFELVFFKHYFG